MVHENNTNRLLYTHTNINTRTHINSIKHSASVVMDFVVICYIFSSFNLAFSSTCQVL